MLGSGRFAGGTAQHPADRHFPIGNYRHSFRTLCLRSDGGVVCWGRWTGGPPPEMFRSVSAGRDYVCDVLQNGAARWWGDEDYDPPPPPEGKFASIHSGDDHICGVSDYGTLTCWEMRQSELLPAPEGRFKTMGLDSQDKACGVRIDGGVTCWVAGSSGELGTLGGPPGKVISVSVQDNLACGVNESGDGTCWVFWSGCKRSSDGSGCTPDENVRIVALMEEKYRDIFVVDTFTVCGLTKSGELRCGLRLEE